MRLTATPVFSYLLVISVTAAAETKDDHIFYFPDYKSFQAAIGRFAEHWMPKSPEQEVPQEAKSRVKRQDPRIGDESQIEWIVKSSSLPLMPDKKTVNARYMPTLGNGNIGTTVYGKNLFVNGLYAGGFPADNQTPGKKGKSHRAAIPALIMTRVNLTRVINDDIARRAIHKYIFNAKEGIFTETIDCDFAYIEHKTYLHMKYIRLLVTDISARRKSGSEGGLISLVYPQLNNTNDIRWDQLKRHGSNWQVSGTTVSAEEGTSPQVIHMFWHDRVPQISIRGSRSYVNETMVMAVDRQQSSARGEFETALRMISRENRPGNYDLYREHVQAWATVWARGRVEMEGDSTISKIAWFSQYYLFSNMPAQLVASQPPPRSEVYTGMGRTSGAKGKADTDYQGHVFWDNEMYIMPVIIALHPDMAKWMLRYRSMKAEAARQNAEAAGDKGIRFPWESASTGREVTPDSCIQCREQQIHVTGAVSWAIRQYMTATRDQDYLSNPEYNGCDVTREIARFFFNRAKYNQDIARYDIKDVMGPDDWHPKVTNNAYTNVVASLAIHWARYMSCLCERNFRTEVPDEWIQAAMHLKLPFDNVRRLHYQHDGFEQDKNNTIKQADTIMLGYPLNWNMSVDIYKNDLEYYEQLISKKTPSMTWSWFTVGWKWVKDDARMLSFFQKSYQDYIIQPFKVWTEFNEESIADQAVGSVNFLPGQGAFLQSIIYGFAGIRYRPEFLEVHRPIPPPGAHTLKLIGFDYLGANMTITIKTGGPRGTEVTIEVWSVDTPLRLRKNDTYSPQDEDLVAGRSFTIENAEVGFFIFPLLGTACEHPRDYIFMPWGYSPFVDSAADIRPYVSIILLFALLSRWLSCR